MADYGEKYDKPIVIVMSLFIVASIAGVVWMNIAAHEDMCVPSYTTYCGDDHGSHGDHGAHDGHGKKDSHSEH